LQSLRMFDLRFTFAEQMLSVAIDNRWEGRS
jgi:hypothetical protein